MSGITSKRIPEVAQEVYEGYDIRKEDLERFLKLIKERYEEHYKIQADAKNKILTK